LLSPGKGVSQATVRAVYGQPSQSGLADGMKQPFDFDEYRVSEDVAIVVEVSEGEVVRSRVIHPRLESSRAESPGHYHPYRVLLADLATKVRQLGAVLIKLHESGTDRLAWASDIGPFQCKLEATSK
jgi:hypothetical protein